jgi:hypothetical protein
MRFGRLALAAAGVVLVLAGGGGAAPGHPGTGENLVRSCREFGIFGLAGADCDVLADITAGTCAELNEQLRERLPAPDPTSMQLWSCADEN